MRRSPTLADVARLAAVSTATVSRCLNAPHAVRPSSRAKVQAAITELGYVPHGAARALASRRSGTIGAIVPTLENSIFAKGIQSLQHQLTEHGMTLVIASSNYSPDQELQEIRALVSRGVDGMVLVGTSHHRDVYQLLRQKSIPCVNTWTFHEHSDHPCVGFDNAQAAYRIARYLLDLGHRRIGMISGLTTHNDRARERIVGVQRALAEADASLPDAWLIERPYSVADGRAALHYLLSGAERPTAVVCGNDVLALGAVLGVRDLGLRIPEDISITGFDDLDLASQIFPTLTTAHVPAERMGKAAAEFLIAKIAGKVVPEHTELEVSLVVRETTGPPPTASH